MDTREYVLVHGAAYGALRRSPMDEEALDVLKRVLEERGEWEG